MDYAGTFLTGNAGQVVTVIEQAMDQGATLVSAGGMYHDAGRLGEHHQIIIFIKNFKRNFFRDKGAGRQRRNVDRNQIINMDSMTCLPGMAVEQNMSILDETLKDGASKVCQLWLVGEIDIQPLALIMCRDLKMIYSGRR